MTIGQEEYEKLRFSHTLVAAHVVLLCYSVMIRETLENAVNVHWPNIQRHATAKVVLVGMHIDSRNNAEAVAKYAKQMVTTAQGQSAAQQLGIKVLLICNIYCTSLLNALHEKILISRKRCD